MSIESEITSMTQNIQADYEGLENIGADLTGIDKNILNIRTILDTIYNDMPKVTGEGTSVTLTPTKKGKLGLVEKGNSTQEGTPTPDTPFPIKSVTGDNNVVANSLNLLNYKEITPVNDNTTILEIPNGIKIINANGGYAGKIEFTNLDKNTNYTLSFNKEVIGGTGSAVRIFRDSTSTNIQTITGNSGIFTTGDYQDKILIWFYASSGTVAEVNFTNIQLEKGSTATDYTPYQNQTLPLNLGTKKALLGDSLQSDGIHHVRNRIRLNTTNFSVYQLEGTNVFYLQKAGTTAERRFYDGPEGFCTHYKMNTTGDVKGDVSADNQLNAYECALRNSDTLNNRERFYIKLTENDTIQTLSTFLDNNEVYLEYTLKEADYYTESYTTEEKAQYDNIQKMQSYNGTTIITSTFDTNNAQMIISASALKGE